MSSITALWRAQHPEQFYLDGHDLPGLQDCLQRLAWLVPEEAVIQAASAGDGNMNCTLRVHTTHRTFILKQARPWVEKYQEIPAPVERSDVEAAFYAVVARYPEVASKMPKLLAYCPASRLLLLEDVGSAPDLRSLYQGDTLSSDEHASLLDYLHCLHRCQIDLVIQPLLANRAMRALNHEHIFHFPLQADNGMDLDRFTPGLADAARSVQEDIVFRERSARLGELYLSEGTHLLHGDFFPGSWLRTTAGIKVIDPEFCFLGPREFDLGVMHAHLILARQIREDPPRDDLTRALAGIEIMRRLIGVAQLPLSYGLEEKLRMLNLARAWVNS